MQQNTTPATPALPVSSLLTSKGLEAAKSVGAFADPAEIAGRIRFYERETRRNGRPSLQLEIDRYALAYSQLPEIAAARARRAAARRV